MIVPLPLLHAAQGAVDTAPPLAVWCICFAVAAAAGALAGAVSRRRMPSARSRRRIAMRVTSAAAALSLLSIVVPYDHLITQATHSAEEAAVHAAHCHDSPSACADAPVTSGPGQMIDAEPLIVVPTTVVVLLLLVAPALKGVSRRPILRPPVGLAASSI